MNLFGPATYLSLLLLSVVVSGILAGFAVKYRDSRGVTAFAVLVVCLFVWSLAEAVAFTTESAVVARTARQAMFVVIPFVPLAVLALAFQYTGRDQFLSATVLGLLAALPTTSALLSLTNPLHGLFWTGGEFATVGNYSIYAVEAGIWYWVHISYTYALLTVASYLFVRWALTADEDYRRQANYLLAGIAFPWGANIAMMLGLIPDTLDLTAVFFTVSGLCIGIAVFRFRFLDLVPVARDTVVEVMRDGVLVLDEEDRVVDANPAASKLLRMDNDDLVGSDIEAVAPAPLVEACLDDRAGETLTLSTPEGERAFDSRRSDLPGGARMVLLYDVTERRRQAEQLKRQNERLEKFGSVLSHDLRNPLNVAAGYAELLEADTEGEEAEHARRTIESLERMEELIDDTLAFTREGPAVTDPEPVSLEDVAQRAWRNVETGDATLEIVSDPIVSGDPERIQRLFENLFRNAVEHAPTDSQPESADAADQGSTSSQPAAIDAVTQTAAPEPLHVRIASLPDGFAVEDNGPGIPAEKRDAVLEFGFTTRDEGTGLGLSIVNEIAESHRWRIEVGESDTGGARLEFHGVEPASGRETP